MWSVSLCLLICIPPVVNAVLGNISSIGQYENDDFIWSHGVPSLSFTIYGSCANVSSISNRCYTWNFGQLQIKVSSSGGRCICENTTGLPTTIYPDGTCKLIGDDGVAETNITINTLSLMATYAIVSSDIDDNNVRKNIMWRYCDVHSDIFVPNVDMDATVGSSNYSFGNEVPLVCEGGFTGGGTIKCAYDATWTSDGSCISYLPFGREYAAVPGVGIATNAAVIGMTYAVYGTLWPSETVGQVILVISVIGCVLCIIGVFLVALANEAGMIVGLVFGCVFLAWSIGAGIYLIVQLCDKKK